MKNQKLIVIISSFILVLSFFLGSYFYKIKQKKKDNFMSGQYAEVFVRKHSPSKGPDNAKVYLVEFLDPECESCRAFHPVVKKVLSQYSKDVKLIIRYTPFHKNSKFAISILEAAKKQNKFWKTLDVIFKSQPSWGNHHNPKPELIWKFLSNVQGLDIEKVRKDIKDPSIKDVIEQDIQDGKRLKVRQTPTFFINGKRLKRLGYEYLKAVIEHELKL
jgi:protein-disulfide isomerase